MSSARLQDPVDSVRPVDPDYPIDPVPPHARRSVLSLLVVLLGFTFFTPTMVAGAQLGTAFSASQLLGVVALGSTILAVYVAALALIGARTGLTTVVMCRDTLGSAGAKGASLLLGGSQVGWYGVAVGTLASLTAAAFGWTSAAAVAALAVTGGALMGVTAYYGYRGMFWLSAVSVPLMTVLAVWVLVRSLQEVGGWAGLAGREGSGELGVAAAVTIVVGTFASGGTQVPNWSRFARTGAQGFLAALGAFLVGNGAMLLFGASGALAFGEGDFVQVLFQLGLVGWGVLLLLGNLWTTNDNAAYAFGVAGAEIFDHPSKKPFVVGGVVLATALAVVGIADSLVTYLLALGLLIPPLGGVLIGDWLRTGRRTGMDPRQSAVPLVRWGNVGAYLAGVLAAWGSSALGLGIPPLVGIVVGAALAAAFGRVGSAPSAGQAQGQATT